MSGLRSNFRFFFKVSAALLPLAINPIASFAQNEIPGEGCDPIDGCPVPLDTWVIILVVVAFAYGYYNLHKKQKAIAG